MEMIQSRDVISEAVFERYLRPQMDDMIRSDDPTTVFLGAQPAAGKTRGQRRILGMYPGASLFPVIGDDYRRYHPDYNRLIAEDPVRMPDVTAELSGGLVGKVVDYADRLGISIIIEGTWRNSATVLGEAERAFAAGRRLHAALLAVPRISPGSDCWSASIMTWTRGVTPVGRLRGRTRIPCAACRTRYGALPHHPYSPASQHSAAMATSFMTGRMEAGSRTHG